MFYYVFLHYTIIRAHYSIKFVANISWFYEKYAYASETAR